MTHTLHQDSPLAITLELFMSDEIEHIKVLTEIHQKLAINNDFDFNLELLERLEFILQYGRRYLVFSAWDNFSDFTFSRRWNLWLTTISLSLKRYRSKYQHINKPYNIVIKTSCKKADVVLYNLHTKLSEHEKGLLIIFIAFHMLPEKYTNGFNQIEITRQFKFAPQLQRSFNSLPLSLEDIKSSGLLQRIDQACIKIIESDSLGSKDKKLSRSIKDVIQIFITAKYKHKRTAAHLEQSPVNIDHQNKKKKLVLEPKKRYSLFHETPQSTESFSFEEILSEPGDENILGLIDSSPNEDSPFIPKLIQEADIKTRSKFWIQNFIQASPWNGNGINPFELNVLTHWIKTHDSKESLLLAFMLCVGTNLNSILELTIEESIYLNGSFLRVYEAPKDHFKPNKDHEDLYIENKTDFIIQLPLIVTDLMNKHFNEEDAGLTIIQALKTDIGKIESEISAVVKTLNNKGARGMARNRIHMILRKQIAIHTDDEFISYLISGTGKEAPPVSSHYTSFNQDTIQQVYDKAIMSIFS